MRTAAPVTMAAAIATRPRWILEDMITSLSLGSWKNAGYLKCGLFEEGHVGIQLNQHFLSTLLDEGQQAGSRRSLTGRYGTSPEGIQARSPAHERLAHGLLPVRRRHPRNELAPPAAKMRNRKVSHESRRDASEQE